MTTSGCEADLLIGEKLQQPSPLCQAVLVFLITINILTFPFTAVLNALVILAVKSKRRLRAHNLLLAQLALTDFVVGVLVQPTFFSLGIMVLVDDPNGYCVLRGLRSVVTGLVDASITHLALLSGERYLAIKHTFTYANIVTESRLLVASTLAWFLSVILRIPIFINKNLYLHIVNTFRFLFVAFIVFCHVAVYRETCRHEKQLAVQQATHEAREQFLRDKKAFKLTSMILAVLFLCWIPLAINGILLLKFRSQMSVETTYMFYCSSSTSMILNSLFNPIIYSVRMRQFRVAFIELLCRTVNIIEAQEKEMQVFGAANTGLRLQAGQEHEGQD